MFSYIYIYIYQHANLNFHIRVESQSPKALEAVLDGFSGVMEPLQFVRIHHEKSRQEGGGEFVFGDRKG